MRRPGGAVVERIVDLSRLAPPRAAEVPAAPETYLEVRFESGESGLLDMSVHCGVVWADVLRSLQERNQPAYLEVDPASSPSSWRRSASRSAASIEDGSSWS